MTVVLENELPEGVRQGDERLIKLTGSATSKVSSLMEREIGSSFLRVGISGGGCNGLSYKMKFVSDARKGDIVADVAIDTYHDHRMAMAFAPLGLSVPIVINDADVVTKSYPSFWDDLISLGFFIDSDK